jgi:hypothetical protein
MPGRRPGDFGLYTNKVYVRLQDQSVIELKADTDTNGPWSVVLAAGNTSGANNPIIDLGQGIIYVGGIRLGLNSTLPTASVSTAIALGSNLTSATGTNSVAIGISASASNTNAIAIGPSATASQTSAIAIGLSSTASTVESIALGSSASSSGSDSVAIGTSSVASNSNTTALGHQASATFDRSTALGFAATTTASKQVMIGNSGAGGTDHVFTDVGTAGRLESGGYVVSRSRVQAEMQADGSQVIDPSNSAVVLFPTAVASYDYGSPAIDAVASQFQVRQYRTISGFAWLTLTFVPMPVSATPIFVNLYVSDGINKISEMTFVVPSGTTAPMNCTIPYQYETQSGDLVQLHLENFTPSPVTVFLGSKMVGCYLA